MEDLYFALRHMPTLARSRARITLTRALANVPVFSCKRQSEPAQRATGGD
jgi:hypothetical protein